MAETSKETSWRFDPKRIVEGIFVTTIGGILVAWAVGLIGLNSSSNNVEPPTAVTNTGLPPNVTPSFVPGSSESNDDAPHPAEITPSFPTELPLATVTPSGRMKMLASIRLSKLMGSSTFTRSAIDVKTTATKALVLAVSNSISEVSIRLSKRQSGSRRLQRTHRKLAPLWCM